MSLSVVIVDDEQLARDELAYLLKSVADVDVVAAGQERRGRREPDQGTLARHGVPRCADAGAGRLRRDQEAARQESRRCRRSSSPRLSTSTR